MIPLNLDNTNFITWNGVDISRLIILLVYMVLLRRKKDKRYEYNMSRIIGEKSTGVIYFLLKIPEAREAAQPTAGFILLQGAGDVSTTALRAGEFVPTETYYPRQAGR